MRHGMNVTEESIGEGKEKGRILRQDEENDSDNDDALINFRSRKE